jgi:hypothetical protein
VEGILEQIAKSTSPEFRALIDTGALITGYSNEEVAKQLFKFGLKWCEGIVFLDEHDRQKVLVKSSGRVVSAEQCSVPIDRRFTFYDQASAICLKIINNNATSIQVHTTGIDVKQVVNAVAVITLGKDMVFRDFVQVIIEIDLNIKF